MFHFSNGLVPVSTMLEKLGIMWTVLLKGNIQRQGNSRKKSGWISYNAFSKPKGFTSLGWTLHTVTLKREYCGEFN